MKLIKIYKTLPFKEQLTYFLLAIIILYSLLNMLYDFIRDEPIYAILHFLIMASFSYFILHYVKYKQLSFSAYGILIVSSIYCLILIYLNDFSLYSYFFPIILPIATYLILSMKESILFILFHYTVLTNLSLYGYFNLNGNSEAFTFISLKIYIFIVTFILLFGIVYHLTLKRNYKDLKEKNINKELALSEIHHRVNNDLNIISSMLSIQKYGSENDKKIQTLIHSNKSRIQAISIIHKLLYQQKNFNAIHFETYLDELLDYLLKESQIIPVRIQKNIDDIYFPFKEMQNFGIILNELINNSMEYAFATVQTPQITVSLTNQNGIFDFIYQDNGKACRPESLMDTKSLGLAFISSSAKQLKSEVTFRCEEGFKCQIKQNPSVNHTQQNGVSHA